MEVKIEIPDNCELIKDGDTYVVKEKKQGPPKSWEEFCERYPKKTGEAFIDTVSYVQTYNTSCSRTPNTDRNICTSKEEAEAFLALMQLRQLRKAWVGDWDINENKEYSVILYDFKDGLTIHTGEFYCYTTMSFPEEGMAREFRDCFKDLLEKAKVLL